MCFPQLLLVLLVFGCLYDLVGSLSSLPLSISSAVKCEIAVFCTRLWVACAKASTGVCNGNGHGKGASANLSVQEPRGKVLAGLILQVKLQFISKKYSVRLQTADDSFAFSKFFTRRGEGHVPLIDHSLTDDINICYIYFTVYLQASGQVAVASSNKMSSITDSPYADFF